MEYTQDIFEKIEDYLAGRLDEKELESFEKLLLTDLKLKEEVQLHSNLSKALKEKKVLDFRKKMIRVERIFDERTKNVKQKPYLSYYWKIAASIVIIIGLSTFLWQINQTEDLYSTYYIPYPIDGIDRGDEDNLYNELAQKYNQGNYREALPRIKKLMKIPFDNVQQQTDSVTNEQSRRLDVIFSERDKLRLYLGNCYLNLNQTNDAITQFKNINPRSIYYQDGLWYTALAFLKLEQEKEAIFYLEEVINNKGSHEENASNLLKKLE